MSNLARVHVLIPQEEAERFDAYCRAQGFKKSTLIVRLIREHLDREKFQLQREMFHSTAPSERKP
jgi:hypothetical protein